MLQKAFLAGTFSVNASAQNPLNEEYPDLAKLLDAFDVTGRHRIRENGAAIDTRGGLYDGTPVDSPSALVEALLRRPEPLVRTLTANPMAYAPVRRV